MQLKKINQKGRTMLEMVGILALIGLLTMGSLALFGNAMTQKRLNDLLSEVRKRALVSNRESSRFTYDMFNKDEDGVTGVIAYGYGVGDNKTGVARNAGVTKVPVGAINNGKKLEYKLCQALLDMVYKGGDDAAPPKIGDVMGLYGFSEKCSNSKITKCGTKTEEGVEDDVPAVLCVGIKS